MFSFKYIFKISISRWIIYDEKIHHYSFGEFKIYFYLDSSESYLIWNDLVFIWFTDVIDSAKNMVNQIFHIFLYVGKLFGAIPCYASLFISLTHSHFFSHTIYLYVCIYFFISLFLSFNLSIFLSHSLHLSLSLSLLKIIWSMKS